jgi:hypothetical protein
MDLATSSVKNLKKELMDSLSEFKKEFKKDITDITYAFLFRSLSTLHVHDLHLELGCVYVGVVIDDKSRDTSEAERMIVIGLY